VKEISSGDIYFYFVKKSFTGLSDASHFNGRMEPCIAWFHPVDICTKVVQATFKPVLEFILAFMGCKGKNLIRGILVSFF
jgi:hypothetical protein